MITHFKLFATFALAIGVNYSAFCQTTTWQTNGNIVTPGQYLGSQNNQPLDVRTDNTHRLRIMPSGTTSINNYPIDHDGFVGMSTNPNFFNLVEPFSLLHLNGQGNGSAGPQQFGYRPWMREGIVFTQNSDLMYIGPMANAQDVTDAVITWSDNWGQGEVGPDVLRFLFTSNGNGTTVISPDPMNPNVLEIAIG